MNIHYEVCISPIFYCKEHVLRTIILSKVHAVYIFFLKKGIEIKPFKSHKTFLRNIEIDNLQKTF